MGSPREEQAQKWFSILRRKRLAAPNFVDLADLESKVLRFISEWYEITHPFDRKPKSFNKILATIDVALPAAA